MSVVWIIPAAIAVGGLVVVAILVREAGSAVRALGTEVGRAGELRPALRTLRSDAAASRRTYRRLRLR